MFRIFTLSRASRSASKQMFEVAPEFELGEYRGLPVKYEEPSVTDEEVDKRLDSMRETKADYVNLDPRPIENGDFVLVHLKSLSGSGRADRPGCPDPGWRGRHASRV